MSTTVDLFSSSYKNYEADLYRTIREETFGEDIGQTSWSMAEDYRHFFSLLELTPGKAVLDLASGSGGPAVFMAKETGCSLTGIDINRNGIRTANQLAEKMGLGSACQFLQGDASKKLPFPDGSFDAVICIDAFYHLKGREEVLQECRRILKPGGRFVHTDSMILTGIITNGEMETRTVVGYFQLTPIGWNEQSLKQAGFGSVKSLDFTGSCAKVSLRWYKAREKRRKELLQFESEEQFERLQASFKMVHKLTSEKRLSRYVFCAVRS